MSTLTVRLPEDTANRLKNLAKDKGLSVNKLISEISIQALAVYDTETRFKNIASKSDVKAALLILDRMDMKDKANA